MWLRFRRYANTFWVSIMGELLFCGRMFDDGVLAFGKTSMYLDCREFREVARCFVPF